MKLPQLTLRDLFWLVLVCALALGLGLTYGNHVARVAELQTDLESEYLRGASDEDARWMTAIERSGLDAQAKATIRREYFKVPGSGLPTLKTQ